MTFQKYRQFLLQHVGIWGLLANGEYLQYLQHKGRESRGNKNHHNDNGNYSHDYMYIGTVIIDIEFSSAFLYIAALCNPKNTLIKCNTRVEIVGPIKT